MRLQSCDVRVNNILYVTYHIFRYDVYGTGPVLTAVAMGTATLHQSPQRCWSIFEPAHPLDTTLLLKSIKSGVHVFGRHFTNTFGYLKGRARATFSSQQVNYVSVHVLDCLSCKVGHGIDINTAHTCHHNHSLQRT